MSWHNIIITKPTKLSLRNSRMVIEQEEKIEIPLEDISSVVVETREAVITSALLSRVAQEAIPVFFCDAVHLPAGVCLPFQQHSRCLKVLNAQLEQTEPFKKNCWKLIVQRKIKNQAKCLELLKLDGADELYALAAEVKSGDTTNRESAAAQIYFNNLMPSATRRTEDITNAALNYGYAIIRGAVARSLTAYGFVCALGIHHKNELNAFNLADDFIEPFRPVVDLWTGKNICSVSEFSVKEKSALVSLLNKDIVIDAKRQNIYRTIEITAASYVSAVKNGDAQLLKLPELIDFAK